MKIRKTLLIVLLGAFLAFGSLSVVMADISSVSPATLTIHEFFVSDLGLTGGGGRNYELFRISFGNSASGGSAPYKLGITVEAEGGGTLLSGETDGYNYSTFQNQTFFNYDLLKRLGGNFDFPSDIPARIQDAIFNTGGVPQGNFILKFRLLDSGDTQIGAERQITIFVLPLFLISLGPADGELVNKQKLDFRWMTNMNRLRLDVYDRPTGGSPIAHAGVTGNSFKWPGLPAKARFEHGKTYYWQITGFKTTTHGEVKAMGPRNQFVYYEGSIPDNITPLDKAEIKAALEKLGVTGLATLKLKWVAYDDSVVFVTDNITSILQCLQESNIDYKVRWE
ncbi:MAG: hypothetical protein JXQ30_06935 [Spirochaetes bacterium]|nr:hypothetical protein [Spirochaetota bacterium]